MDFSIDYEIKSSSWDKDRCDTFYSWNLNPKRSQIDKDINVLPKHGKFQNAFNYTVNINEMKLKINEYFKRIGDKKKFIKDEESKSNEKCFITS